MLSRALPDAFRQQFIRAAGWSVAGAACLRAFNLLAWMACGRLLGRVVFGQFSMVLSTVATLWVLAGMGLGATATKYIAESRHTDARRVGRILALASTVSAVSATAMGILVMLLAPQAAARLLANTQLVTPLRISALLLWCAAYNGCQIGALAGFEAFRAIARVNLWSGLVTFVAVVVGARLTGLHGAIFGMTAGQMANCFLSHSALRRECAAQDVRYAFAGCLRELSLLSRFALPALLSSTLLLPAMWTCNLWLVRQSGGYAQLGLYAAADRWRLLILFVPSCIFTTVLPMLSSLRGRRDESGFRATFEASIALNMALVAVPGIVVAAIARPLMSAFGTAYAEGWPILAVLALGAIAEALNTALGQPLITESMWRRLGVDVLLVGALLGSARILIPRWGAVGLAIAYALAFVTAVLALLICSRSYTSVVNAKQGASACPEG